MSLSNITKEAVSRHIDLWMRIGLSTQPADRKTAERAVRDTYRIVGLPQPSRFFWLDSPMAGAIAASMASTSFKSVHERAWRMPQDFMSKKLWKKAAEGGSAAHWKDVHNHINGSSLLGLRNQVLMPVGQQIVSQSQNKTQNARATVFVKGKRSGADMPPEVWNRASAVLKAELSPAELKNLNNFVTWEVIAQQLRSCSFGSMDAAFLAFPDYADMAGMQLGDIGGIVGAAKVAGWWWAFDDIVIITERPRSLSLNRAGALHKAEGYAIEFADGWGVHALNGRAVPRDLANSARSMTVDQIESEEDAAVRRQMIEVYGLDRFLRDSGAAVIHQDQSGMLFRKELPGQEPVVVVKVATSTPNADGSPREFFLRVPPSITTAQAAVAWTYGRVSSQHMLEFQR